MNGDHESNAAPRARSLQFSYYADHLERDKQATHLQGGLWSNSDVVLVPLVGWLFLGKERDKDGPQEWAKRTGRDKKARPCLFCLLSYSFPTSQPTTYKRTQEATPR